jgi:hypothetical protein
MISQSEWKWFGFPMHLCVARECVFHLATQVGQYVISTVGDYYPLINGRRVREQVGCDRFGETYVFKVDGQEKCGCPSIDLSEIDSTHYGENDRCTEMNAGHLAMCMKYAEMQ